MPQALSNLAVGAKIKFGTLYGSSLVWTLADKNHSGYPTGAVTFVAEKIIKLMCADAIESSNSDSNRKSYGNNRWIYSNIRQWMNSAAAAGAWYSAQHSADAAPTNANVWSNYNEYDAIAGFLNGFTANEQAALLSTSLTVGKASVDGGSTETDTCKIFNLSATEVGLTGDFTEGSILSLFNTSSNRIAYPTASAVSNSEYTSGSLSASQAWYWWLRTPYASNSCSVRYVSTGGSLNFDDACYGNGGLRPAFNLSSGLLISDSTDSDGCYTVVYNTAPTTPASISVPTTVNGGQSLTVTWGASTDTDGNLSGYKLERQYASEGWVQVYVGSSRTFAETITYGKATVAYRVKAYDAAGAESGYNTSATRTIINNHEPTISGSDTNLGTFGASAPSTSYIVNDEDGDTVAVVVKLDGTIIQSFNATLGAANALTFTAAAWQQILNGVHTFVITATDPQSAVAARTITFTKSVTTVEFTTDVLAADDMPTKAMFNIQGAFPTGCTLTIEACNNANDTSPAWEDVTTRVVNGQKVFFSNTTKTATDWGVALHVTLERGTATDPCNITAIGGNFA